MTVEQKPPQTALARYQAEMSRKRTYYFAILTAVVVAVVVLVSIAWSHGEITHVTTHTAATPAPSVLLQSPSPVLQQAWQSNDHAASGTPIAGGTVVTFDEHTVRGRNAATGAVTWSYHRGNRTVCDAAQAGGATVAIYELNGNCDEVTTLDSETGKRKWTRTLAENAQPLDGRPAAQVSQFTIMLTTPSVIYAVDPASGIDRWQFAQQGCTVRSAVLGSSGALISQTCDHPDCNGKKFCGSGPQLLLRDSTGSRNDSDSANTDRIKWNLVGNAAIPVSSDGLISAFDPATGALQVFDSAKGKRQSTLVLDPAPGNSDSVGQSTTTSAELIHIGGHTYCVPFAATSVLWSAATPVLPTVTATDAVRVPDLKSAVVAVPTADGIAVLDGGTGRPTRTFAAAAPASGSTVFPLGTGFVVAGSSTTVYR